jgi:hypothetical protein
MRFVDGRIHFWVPILAVGIGGSFWAIPPKEDIISKSQLPATDIHLRNELSPSGQLVELSVDFIKVHDGLSRASYLAIASASTERHLVREPRANVDDTHARRVQDATGRA